MNSESRYETERIDHLGIVAGICQEIGLIEEIDRQVGSSEQKVSCGQGVQAMVLNALGFSGRALYLMPDYLHNKPVDVLIGPGLRAEDFNDDSLGRSLETLYAKGVTEVFAKVAARALSVYWIEHRFVHVDSSSFHLHGQYEVEDPDKEAITITEGYSRDHRPDLKQVVVQLITSQKSALPIWLEVLSGNSSDKESFPLSVEAYNKQIGDGEAPYYVMDSAGYAADNLKALKTMRWLMRVPETLAEAKRLVRESEKAEMVSLTEGYWGRAVKLTYGEIEQRWLVVFSQAAYERELHTLTKSQEKERLAAEKQWHKLSLQTFNCQQDAESAAKRFNQGWKFHQIVTEAAPITRYAKRGRPTAEDEPEIVGYGLKGSLSAVSDRVEAAKRNLGKFIIATNELDEGKLSAVQMLSNYTDQGISVERGFRFLKDPLFFADSLFLKKPERIMALIMIMGLALLIYALAERQLRLALEKNQEKIPDQKGKPTATPTIRWVFQIFEGIDILSIWVNGQRTTRQVLNLGPVHQQVLQLFGREIRKCYLINTGSIEQG
ncbi:MAG TPA: IS1634 family transposase [Anaerolineaceae bacterium]|nr:IS1634 family transposase [Anaerolineaceae bacterium]